MCAARPPHKCLAAMPTLALCCLHQLLATQCHYICVLTAQARLAAEEKRIRFEQQQQGAAASQVEETSFASLVAGQARELIQRQHSAKQEALQYEATKNKAQAVRMKAVRKDQKAKTDFIKAYDDSMKQLRVTDHQNQQQDLLRRKSMVNSQKDFEHQLQQTHREQSYKPGSSSEGPAAALLKQLSLGMLASEVSNASQTH